MWAQKAKSNRTVYGDRNTRFYQTVVKQRRTRNRIIHLKSINGDVLDKLEEIKQHLVDHFQEQYYDPEVRDVQSILQELETIPIPKLDQNQQQLFDRPVIDEEIVWAVHQLIP
ncbi:hypothetical protein CMV_010922 [Castanea mollissima]|uniref:Uncharacterized protein n=1 Tax=Castanea mollissima TaxID=60419 RepID=A0A8J4RHL5_9ROSI|nr:hypothetical protein CMV_010922 [Castanea mollissima]